MNKSINRKDSNPNTSKMARQNHTQDHGENGRDRSALSLLDLFSLVVSFILVLREFMIWGEKS